MYREQFLSMNFVSGEVIYIDKPYGWTSFDAVKRLRGALMRRMGLKKFKVGHAGTLDPLATGVMILCTGRATKRIEELQAGTKVYEAEIALGATTPSYDLETEIDATYPTEHITRQMVEEALQGFVGTIRQIPPAYSAIKVDGKRAYESARKGKDVTLKPKTLTIDEISLTEYSPELLKIRVVCSKGTYIRALARDIGEALKTGAHLKNLRRTRVGDVDISECLTIDQAAELIRTVEIEYPDDWQS